MKIRKMGDPSKPCPYAPFGIPCLKGFAHGSPHRIEVEAAYVEKVLSKNADRALTVFSRAMQERDPALATALAAFAPTEAVADAD